jgi:hypothetical protein
MELETVGSSETLVNYTRLHDVASQKVVNLVFERVDGLKKERLFVLRGIFQSV